MCFGLLNQQTRLICGRLRLGRGGPFNMVERRYKCDLQVDLLAA